ERRRGVPARGGRRGCACAEVHRRRTSPQGHRRARQTRERGRVVRAATAAFVFSIALAACGFRLAGSPRRPPVLAKPYLSVKDPYTDFSREFERELKSSGALLQDGRQDATATIEVTKDV